MNKDKKKDLQTILQVIDILCKNDLIAQSALSGFYLFGRKPLMVYQKDEKLLSVYVKDDDELLSNEDKASILAKLLQKKGFDVTSRENVITFKYEYDTCSEEEQYTEKASKCLDKINIE